MSNEHVTRPQCIFIDDEFFIFVKTFSVGLQQATIQYLFVCHFQWIKCFTSCLNLAKLEYLLNAIHCLKI